MHRLVQKMSLILLGNNEYVILNNLLQNIPAAHLNKFDDAVMFAFEVATNYLLYTYEQIKIINYENGFTEQFIKNGPQIYYQENVLVFVLRDNIEVADWMIQILKTRERHFNCK